MKCLPFWPLLPFRPGMLNWRHLLSADVMRWSLAAHDICFTRPFHCWFFASGKCVPIVRGEGVYQVWLV